MRPTLDRNGGTRAAIRSFTDDGLFRGQPPKFFATLDRIAAVADDAQRS